MIKQRIAALKSAAQSWHPNLVWIISTASMLLLTYGLRVWDVGYDDLGFDEVATYYIANRSLGDVIRYVMGASREHPPFYYLLISLWLRAAGSEEFVIRYPTALIAVIATAWSIHLGRRFINKEGGWWTGLLMAVLPFSIETGRTARMYTLVTLLALITIELWWQWLRHPNLKHWGAFLAVAIIGAVTHYYLVFLWVVEGTMLLLFPKHTRPIRWLWLATVASGILIMILAISLSPGVWATLRETGSRFPVRTFRLDEFKEALMDLYLNWHHATLWPVTAAGLGCTFLGWGLTWRKSRVAALLLALWAVIPVAIVVTIPETIRARYLLQAFPAFVIGLAATITLLRPHWLKITAAILILLEIGLHWTHVYHQPDTALSRQIEKLHQLARPGDVLVLNGPWHALQLNYYTPPEFLQTHLVPHAAPPGFIAEEDIPRLEQILADYERVWVSYDTVEPADPEYRVSLWFAENMYNAYRFRDLLLYLREPDQLQTFTTDLAFGEKLQIKDASINSQEITLGDPLFIRLGCECQDLSWRTLIKLGLLDQEGRLWGNYEFFIGPKHHAQSKMPEDWVERRALWLNEPGVPPGEYTLALRVRDDKGTVIQEESSAGEWAPLQKITLTNTVTDTEAVILADGEEIPTWASVEADFGDHLQLVGSNPESKYILQGSPLELTLWWQAKAPLEDAKLHLRLIGPGETESQAIDLAPSFYPVRDWQTGEIIRQEVSFQIPRDLPGGRYRVQASVTGADDTTLNAKGSRESLTFWEYLRNGKRVDFQGDWADLYLVMVGERERTYRLPLFLKKSDAYFGSMLRFRGYRLTKSTLRPGESADLTEYWQATAPPDKRYAVFNHLTGSNGEIIWQQDSWPQGGQYTTEYWIAGEIVDERYQITIPEGTPTGEYTLYMGVYDPETVVRLAATDPQGQSYLNEMVPLLTITIKP